MCINMFDCNALLRNADSMNLLRKIAIKQKIKIEKDYKFAPKNFQKNINQKL